MVDHLEFWHNIERAIARRIVHHPEREVPDWVQPNMDERAGMLRQISLDDAS